MSDLSPLGGKAEIGLRGRQISFGPTTDRMQLLPAPMNSCFHQMLSTSRLRPDCRAILASVGGSTVHRRTVA
jgi:hypothetical protein